MTPAENSLTIYRRPLVGTAPLVLTADDISAGTRRLRYRGRSTVGRADLVASVPGNQAGRLEATDQKRAGNRLTSFHCKQLGLWLRPAESDLTGRGWLGMLSGPEGRALRK